MQNAIRSLQQPRYKSDVHDVFNNKHKTSTQCWFIGDPSSQISPVLGQPLVCIVVMVVGPRTLILAVYKFVHVAFS